MENETFKRTEYNSHGARISAGVYNGIIGLVLLWGFILNWLMLENIPLSTIQSIHPFAFIIGYLVCCFAGILLFTKSDNPLFSFIGYNLVVIPFGLVIQLVVAQYDPRIVKDAIFTTGSVTLIMMILGSLFPAFFKKIIGALTVALIAVIVVELIAVFIFKTHHGIIDWIVAAIFCGYIGYDWGRANSIPKTVDNAIDSAASLYMDIINLFIRILRILGRK